VGTDGEVKLYRSAHAEKTLQVSGIVYAEDVLIGAPHVDGERAVALSEVAAMRAEVAAMRAEVQALTGLIVRR
jgi:hypothetical protein